MSDAFGGFGFTEHGKAHTQVHADRPGLCPTCLERYITGHGVKTELIEEVVDGVKTGKWICPLGGPSYWEQVQALDDPAHPRFGLRG